MKGPKGRKEDTPGHQDEAFEEENLASLPPVPLPDASECKPILLLPGCQAKEKKGETRAAGKKYKSIHAKVQLN